MPGSEALPFRTATDGLRVAVRLTPKARKSGVDGIRPTADGGAELVVRVTAAPERGKANAALLRLLAKEWGLPTGALALVAGVTDRHKQVLVQGDAAQLQKRLRAWLKESAA